MRYNSDKLSCWALSKEDELICLIVRSVFDKRFFSKEYIKKIKELLPLVDEEKIIQKFNLIFFKYTNNLSLQIKENKYEDIISNYIRFKDY